MSDPESDDIYREALILAELAAREAAEFIQSHSGRVTADLIHEKGLNDIVSFVDEGAQDIILGLIRRAYPDHHILAEEGFNPAEVDPRHQEGYSWIVDPLDGTTNFMHGVPQYGISIALMLNGKAMMGLVYDVCRGESFSAIRGAGARFGDASCRVSRTGSLANSLIATGFPYKQFNFLDAYTECIRRFWQDSRGVRRPGAASLDLAWVACGRFEGFFEQGLMPWDVAAGALIVGEAGGRYSDFSDSDSADLGSEIVASNGLIHDEMIERLIPPPHPGCEIIESVSLPFASQIEPIIQHDIMSGHGLLEGKKGVILGALNDSSIAWKIALAAYREGARFILSNAPVAKRLGGLDELAEKTESSIVWADATSGEELDALFTEAKTEFGGIDFIVHSIGMGINVRKNRPYEDLNYEWYKKSLDISAISLHRVIHSATTTDALNDGGSVVALTYIGAQRTFSKYSEMGDAKALLESIVRSYGYRLGKRKIRVNSISQSPTVTTAGSGIAGFDAMFKFAERIAPMGNADAESCADYTVSMLSDLTRMVTMQTLFHDGGFSTMGISDELIEDLAKTYS